MVLALALMIFKRYIKKKKKKQENKCYYVDEKNVEGEKKNIKAT